MGSGLDLGFCFGCCVGGWGESLFKVHIWASNGMNSIQHCSSPQLLAIKQKGKPIFSRYPNMLSAFITGTAVNCLNVINRICTIQRFYISTVMHFVITRGAEKMRDGG